MRGALAAALALAALAPAFAGVAPAAALPGDTGVEGNAFVEVGVPTESKPESKVWFHDGSWWSVQVAQTGVDSMMRPTGSTFIAKLDAATGTWTDTTVIDNRGTAKADVLADGNNLYISSHKTDRNTGVTETTVNNRSRFYKFTYSGGTYTKASGYPKEMNPFEMEALTIDRSSTGALWAAWVMGTGPDPAAPAPKLPRKVWTQYSTDDGATWSTPVALTDTHAVATSDDIAAIVAFGTKVGVMWADQVAANDGFWFSVHDANPATGTWSAAESVYTGAGFGDDHVNLKAIGDRVFAVVKTRQDTMNKPLVVLAQRSSVGTWTRRTAYNGLDNVTRPIVQLNSSTLTATVFATGPIPPNKVGEKGGKIYAKTVPLDGGAFAAGLGTEVMGRSTSLLNNVTGSKAPATNTTGVVVLAADGTTKRYWHYRSAALTAPGAPSTPQVFGGDGQVTLSWTAPLSNGGSAITGYVITPYIGASAQPTIAVPASPTSATVPATNGTAYTYKVAAVNAIGTGPQSAASPSVTPMAVFVPPGSVYVPINPCRVVDTRTGGGGQFAPNATRNYQVGGTGAGFVAQGGKAGGCGIPDGAKAVEASVTAVTPTGTGFFRAWPNGTAAPNATFLNYTGAEGVTNTGALTLAASGTQDLTVKNFGASAHYVIDVQGYFVAPADVPVGATGAVYVAINPCRVVDTRTGGGGVFAPNATRDYQVAGSGAGFATQGGKAGGCGIPDGAAAVEASVTAVTPTGDGFFRAWPAGSPAPNATFLNFTNGEGVTNTGSLTLAPTGTQDLTVKNFGGPAHYVVDIQGYFVKPADVPVGATGAYYVAINPCRVVDTRTGGGGVFAPNATRPYQVAGTSAEFAAQGGKAGGCGIPDGSAAVEASVTAVTPTGNGFFRAWPTGTPAPNATFLNFTDEEGVTNTGALTLAATGVQDLTVKNFGGPAHYVIDVQGYYTTGLS